MKRKKVVLIFSGNNQRAVIAFCRVCKEKEVPFFIISSGSNDTIYDTLYSDSVVYKRKNRRLEFQSILSICLALKVEKDIDELIVLPSTEFLNRFLLSYKKEFEEEGIVIPLVEKEIYEKVSDKASFSRLCENYGLTVPGKISRPDKESIPFVLKPKKYFTSKNKVQIKPQIIATDKNFNRIMDKIDQEDLFCEEYIDGECYYLLFYISRICDDMNVIFSQQNLIQQAEGGSMIAAVSSQLHTKKISKKYLQLLRQIKFSGLIMIELKRYKGEYFMIEANPRLWGPSQLFVDANIPIFDQFLNELGFETGFYKEAKKARYFWNGGLIDNLREGKKLKLYKGGESVLKKELSEWKDYDIYNRVDTKKVFIDESKI